MTKLSAEKAAARAMLIWVDSMAETVAQALHAMATRQDKAADELAEDAPGVSALAREYAAAWRHHEDTFLTLYQNLPDDVSAIL